MIQFNSIHKQMQFFMNILLWRYHVKFNRFATQPHGSSDSKVLTKIYMNKEYFEFLIYSTETSILPGLFEPTTIIK